MSKPKIPNQRNEYKKLDARLNKYVLQVEDIYTAITEQAARMTTRVGYEGDKEFRFSDYPQIKAQVDEMVVNYVTDMENLIYAGTSAEWQNSNLVQDLLVNKVLKAYNAQVSGQKYKVYYDPNSAHLKAFQTRIDRGMNLSQRLWSQSSDMLTELEDTISTAIKKGMSAVTLSKRISKYLQDFPSMQKDYKARYGKATRSGDCEYRSIRLARSEINMAYRTAENERWRNLDFVVGYEIKVSHRHRVKDICDELAGKYPKDFEWVGWHPNCTDYKVPILKTEDEFFSVSDKPSVNEVKDVPDCFKKWVRENKDSIERSQKRGTQPYFVRDNAGYIAKAKNGDVVKEPKLLSVSGSDVNNTMLKNLHRNADMYGVDIRETDEFIEKSGLNTKTGKISDRDDEKLTVLYEKNVNAVLSKIDSFHEKKNRLLSMIDEHYDYGDFAISHKNAIKKITVSESLHYNDAVLALDNYRKKLIAEYKEFAENPIKLKSKFRIFDDHKYLNAQKESDLFDSIMEMMKGLYGSRLPMSPLYNSMTDKGKSIIKASMEFNKEYNNGLKEILESVNKLKELQSADLSNIYAPWISRFNNYMCNINAHDIIKDGYIHIYNDIEGAYNIFKLSTDKRCIKHGLDKLSSNTPYVLVEKFSKFSSYPFGYLADKMFYDGFEEFIPVIMKHDKAFFSSEYKHVCFDIGKRVSDNPMQARRFQYHEFGHAMDQLQSSWRRSSEWINLYDSASDVYNKDKGWVSGQYINGSTYRERLENLYVQIKGNRDMEEMCSAASDVLQALDKDHIYYFHGGHDKGYYDKYGKDICLAEIIAHAAEFYWEGNTIFARVNPSLYENMRNLYKSYFENYKNKRY